ncbi:hypothetical protein AJ79_08278 [Helicocarpus griseus UAMH5409]|uniref:Lysine-specific metallo-endopeptidase domain-containing protein n=1 Tax=Helicocarpus griseus UAMH5409 TaxID=1447875 RepID=A0A2B7WLL3_9EURO|nr:hypothetical protein AJ79_08278 [Helicocarpus griseus UAMH5409]
MAYELYLGGLSHRSLTENKSMESVYIDRRLEGLEECLVLVVLFPSVDFNAQSLFILCASTCFPECFSWGALGLAVLASSAAAQNGPTWWADSSCDSKFGRGGLDRLMEQTIEAGQMIQDRMVRNREQEAAAHLAFETLFKFKTADEEPDTSLDFPARTDMLLALASSKNRGSLGMKVVEPPISASTVITAAGWSYWQMTRTFLKVTHQILRKISTQRGSTDGTAVVMKTGCLPAGDEDSDTDDMPATVTICDYYFERNLRQDTIPQGFPRLNTEVQWLNRVGSMMMFHEVNSHLIPTPVMLPLLIRLTQMTHRDPEIGTTDFAYGWSDSLKLSADQAVDNADTYSLFASSIRALEAKLSLRKSDPESGRFERDNSIPDRVKHGVHAKEHSKRQSNTTMSCQDEKEGSWKVCKEFKA